MCIFSAHVVNVVMNFFKNSVFLVKISVFLFIILKIILYFYFYTYVKSESVSCSVLSKCLWPMDCSLPGSSVHGILQARILEWIAIPFSVGSSQPRDPTWVSCIAGVFFTIWATRGGPHTNTHTHIYVCTHIDVYRHIWYLKLWDIYIYLTDTYWRYWYIIDIYLSDVINSTMKAMFCSRQCI